MLRRIRLSNYIYCLLATTFVFGSTTHTQSVLQKSRNRALCSMYVHSLFGPSSPDVSSHPALILAPPLRSPPVQHHLVYPKRIRSCMRNCSALRREHSVHQSQRSSSINPQLPLQTHPKDRDHRSISRRIRNQLQNPRQNRSSRILTRR